MEMKLSISRIEKINEDYKPVNEIVEEVIETENKFVSYELVNEKVLDSKLVYKNSNHWSMLNKHLMFEYFYVILPVFLVIFLLSLFSNSIIMISLAVCGVIYIPYKLLVISEVPYKLIFEGLNIFEVNHLGKRIERLYSNEIGTTESLSKELLHITSNKRGKEKMKILVIKNNHNDFRNIEFLSNYFSKFNNKTNLN